ncbi:MAG: hypothetical protein IVW57_16130 [Ktedonobacterales bacterium]|nr:hypothetical protein [Ktedonobacterales bacterium]
MERIDERTTGNDGDEEMDPYGKHDIEYWVPRNGRLVPASVEDLIWIHAYERERARPPAPAQRRARYRAVAWLTTWPRIALAHLHAGRRVDVRPRAPWPSPSTEGQSTHSMLAQKRSPSHDA